MESNNNNGTASAIDKATLDAIANAAISGLPSFAACFAQGFAEGCTPEPKVAIYKWCNDNIKLSNAASSEPGYFRWQRTPYVKGIYEALENDNDIREVVWIAGAQVAKTQTGNNFLLSTIVNAPGPFLYVAPSVDLAKLASKQRIAPLIEDSEPLRKRLPTGKRDSGNTVLLKEYDGGILRFTGANSAAGLRSMPAKYLYCDEIDAFPRDIDGEGDPIDLAKKRLTTYRPVSKTFLTSTPTIKHSSAIEREFLQTDQRYFYVPCPHCLEKQVLLWENVVWDGRDSLTARMKCSNAKCGMDIAEASKTWMLENGEWRATADGKRGAAGFHLSSLYSPLGWLSWSDMVEEFLAAEKNPEKLKTFINTRLAETWEERNEAVDEKSLHARAENYGGALPAGVLMLTSSTDVQDNRLETLVVGWGRGEEMWTVEHNVFFGNLEEDRVWTELSQFLDTKYVTRTADGGEVSLGISVSTIDTGGHYHDRVMRFVKANQSKGVIAIKGASTYGKDVITKSKTRNEYNVALRLVGTDTVKDKLFARLNMKHPGPGFVHFHSDLGIEFFEQVTAEKLVTKYVKGKGTQHIYTKIRDRNEALDLLVYNVAALYSKGVVFVRKLGAIPVGYDDKLGVVAVQKAHTRVGSFGENLTLGDEDDSDFELDQNMKKISSQEQKALAVYEEHFGQGAAHGDTKDAGTDAKQVEAPQPASISLSGPRRRKVVYGNGGLDY